MAARYVALFVTAVHLAACGTTASTTVSEPEATSASPKGSSNSLVVRSPLVPDDDMMPASAPVAKTAKPTRRVAMADASSAPVVEEPVIEKPVVKKPVIAKPEPEKSKPADTAVIGAPGNTGGSSGPGGGTPATDPAPPASSGTTPTEMPLSQPFESAPTVSAEPVAAPPPAPSPFAVDFKDMINTTIAGFPLWLMVVVGILLAAALVFGLGGARRPKQRVEPAREEHTYAEADEEAVPA